MTLNLFLSCYQLADSMTEKRCHWQPQDKVNDFFTLYTKNLRKVSQPSECFLLKFYTSKVARIKETTDINFIKMLIEGPEVSLNGSPTVSPTTAALCGSDFL